MKAVHIVLFHLLVRAYANIEVDSNGYIMYCPCMGRFGNQADHFLGALGFSHGLNRTLILPPWVEYQPGKSRSNQVSFDTYFKVEPLLNYHRVVLMRDFMQNIAPIIWPKESRTVFCYVPRHNSDGCNAKEGNPFGPFWDHFNIDFTASEFYRPLTYDVYHQAMGEKWNTKYPPSQWPVLAFTGAPGSFPVQQENTKLHKYLQWNDRIQSAAKAFISTLPRGPFVAIHLRNGLDWVRACDHVEQTPALFAAPQCLGYRGEHGPASKELCLPTKQTILRQLRRIIKTISAKSIFVASDNDHMIDFFNENFRKMNVTAHKLSASDPHVELAVIGLSNHFIGNCVSSFSAFAVRERRSIGFPVTFWAFPTKKRNVHTEL